MCYGDVDGDVGVQSLERQGSLLSLRNACLTLVLDDGVMVEAKGLADAHDLVTTHPQHGLQQLRGPAGPFEVQSGADAFDLDADDHCGLFAKLSTPAISCSQVSAGMSGRPAWS